MNFDLVLSYYKSFCTKISDLSLYFGKDSTFFFIEKLGKTSIAFGKQDIKRQLETHFWSSDVSLIAYNIDIEYKTLTLSPMANTSDMAVVVFGTLNPIHRNEDIALTKLMGRKFVQTFQIHGTNNNNYFKTSVLSFVTTEQTIDSPTQVCESAVMYSKADTKPTLNTIAETLKAPTAQELEFEKIVRNIDKLMNESNELDEDLSNQQIECQLKNDLLPISVNEIIMDSCLEGDNQCADRADCDPFNFKHYQYLRDIWPECQTISDSEIVETNKDKNQRIEDMNEYSEKEDEKTVDDNQNVSTSFADALRNGSQCWSANDGQLTNKSDNESRDLRIFPVIHKSKLKSNNLQQNSGKFIGQQNITIIGAQDWYDVCESNVLFIANIPLGFSKTQFMSLFDIYGKIVSIKFVDRTGVSFAFIRFDNKTSVETILNATTGNNCLHINGLHLKADRYKRRIS